jgi:hypothetical protein
MVSGRRMDRRPIERYRRVRENHSDSGDHPTWPCDVNRSVTSWMEGRSLPSETIDMF